MNYDKLVSLLFNSDTFELGLLCVREEQQKGNLHDLSQYYIDYLNKLDELTYSTPTPTRTFNYGDLQIRIVVDHVVIKNRHKQCRLFAFDVLLGHEAKTNCKRYPSLL